MSVLIRGMEMPTIEDKHYIKAEIRNVDGKFEFGIMTGGYSCSEQWTYYPLVEVPPHGDLIDRNALEMKIEQHEKHLKISRYDRDLLLHYLDVEMSPTVIEAEEGE